MNDRRPLESKPASETVRRRILSALDEQTMTARDLSKQLRISEKEVLAHMAHVGKSLHPPKRLVVEPSLCNKCGFTFDDRRKFSIPSRCPRCRHEGISPPAFRIVPR